jgi:NAD(P)-dependent dehydrogenase (short-subunit alcohol dehydrogenase family)
LKRIDRAAFPFKRYRSVQPHSSASNQPLAGDKPVALVTGGGRGIGRGICLELARAGYRIAINFAENEAASAQTKSLVDAHTESLLCKADVATSADRERLVDQVLAHWGRIDALVNNAAITSIGRRDILEATEESWDRVLAVNLKGPYFLSQRVAHEMIRLLPGLVNPAIVNICSVSAYAASTNRGDYCISKAGLSMATQLFAARLAEYGIHVYEVRPGIIDTDMTAGVHDTYDRLISEGLTPTRRWGTPVDVGKAVATLVNAQIPFGTGNIIHVDGGLHIRRL